MLHERLEKCEDDIALLFTQAESLKRSVHLYVKYTYFYFEYEVPIQEQTQKWEIKKQLMDDIFRHRSKFLPSFAYIKWIAMNNSFGMKVYMIVNDPIQLIQMQQWNPCAKCVKNFEGAYGELKALIKKDIGYYAVMPPPHDDIGVELWTLGGDKIDFDLQIEMTDEPFTNSPNYSDAYSLQCCLHEFVKFSNWFELFGIEK
jgi:hypothetical protein